MKENYAVATKFVGGQVPDDVLQFVWTGVSGDELPSGIDLMVYDMALDLSSPGSAIMQLQKAVDAQINGRFDAETQHAVETSYNLAVLVNLWSVQAAYYRALPRFEEYGADWLMRAAKRLQASLNLALPAS